MKHLAPLLDSLDAEFMEREGMCLPIPGEGERARVFSLDGSGLISSCETALPEAQAQPGERDVPRFDGVCEGRILERPSGVGGFGYDSLFVPAGFSQTFAELGDEAKNQISHRANALRQLKQALL